ncbi:MAG: DUF1538 domain-containing protein [Thermacetogeniaceae bacterium]|nr:DUF1538 domain-containing protein [Syntrophomonadaceae bacterium]
MNVLIDKLKEVLGAVLPITIIVLILNFTLVPIETPYLIRFLLGALLIILGLAVFLFGVDIGVTPIGNLLGSVLVRTNKLWFLGAAGLLLGFFIAIAEPDLHVLAGQVELVTSGLISKVSLLVVVSIGIGALLSLGLMRIVLNIPLHKLLTILYLIILVIGIFISPEFLAISFDASGAVTGALVVPFVLALGIGVTRPRKDSKASEEDSFGLVAIAAVGAIITVMIMGIISGIKELSGTLDATAIESASIIAPFIQQFPITFTEIVVALLPLLIVYLIVSKKAANLSRRAHRRILKGLLYTLIGLVLFLVGVNAGFMDVARLVGFKLASLESSVYVVMIGFILGLVIILAEPGVYVLTNQIEDVTSGYIKRKVVMVALCIGVGLSVALSMIRIIVPGIQLWHYLLPGYLIIILASYIVPRIFVGIAFDSGTVASGPMAATFILAFAQGAAEAIEGASVLIDGFGVIAMVTLTPLFTLQILGLLFKVKSVKGGIQEDGTPS